MVHMPTVRTGFSLSLARSSPPQRRGCRHLLGRLQLLAMQAELARVERAVGPAGEEAERHRVDGKLAVGVETIEVGKGARQSRQVVCVAHRWRRRVVEDVTGRGYCGGQFHAGCGEVDRLGKEWELRQRGDLQRRRRAVDHVEIELAVSRTEDVAGGEGSAYLAGGGGDDAVEGHLDPHAPDAAFVRAEVETRLVEPSELVRRAGDDALAAARRDDADVDLRPERRRDIPGERDIVAAHQDRAGPQRDRKSTRLNSSHVAISYAVF